MASLWRNPWLAIGAVLVILGAGNWLVSRNKIAEYTPRAAAAEGLIEPAPPLDEFPYLAERTHRTLLLPLREGVVDENPASAKLDFYRVVRDGGLVLLLLGWFLIAVALLQTRRARRYTLPGPAAS
jgi:hypothetical protein